MVQGGKALVSISFRFLMLCFVTMCIILILNMESIAIIMVYDIHYTKYKTLLTFLGNVVASDSEYEDD